MDDTLPTPAGRDAMKHGLRCLVCYDGKGNGYCSDHALAAILEAIGLDPSES